MKIKIKAIFLGALVDFGGSIIIGSLLIGIGFAIYYAKQGVPMGEIESKMYSDTLPLVTSIIVGYIFTFLGGFVTGKIAKSHEILNSAFLGFIVVIFGIPFWNRFPIWFNLFGLFFTVPIAMLGGKVSIKK